MNMNKKLKSKKGFTLLEVLCAFLVLALSAGLFASSVGVSNRINVEAQKQREAFFQEMSETEQKINAAVGTNELKINKVSDGTEWLSVEIKVYTGKSTGDGLIYYELN